MMPGSAELPEQCAVVGGGRMGAGSAHALLLAGAEVTVLERDAAEAGHLGRKSGRGFYDGSVER